MHWKYLLIRKQSFTFRGIRLANLAHRILRAIELVQTCMDYWCKLNRLAERSVMYSHLTWSKEKNKLNEQTPGSDQKFIGIIERSSL